MLVLLMHVARHKSNCGLGRITMPSLKKWMHGSVPAGHRIRVTCGKQISGMQTYSDCSELMVLQDGCVVSYTVHAALCLSRTCPHQSGPNMS